MKSRKTPLAPIPRIVDATNAALRQNAILNGLDPLEFDALIKYGTFLDMPVRFTIYRAEERIGHVYFPIDCVISVVTQMKDGSQIEVGTIGREGISAIPLLLGATTSANDSYCQVPGKALKIDVDVFQRFSAKPRFRLLLDRYVQAYVNMLGQLAACNRLHSIYERCARWLLMTQDRVDAPTFLLTHEFLAMMLGTQRSGVTIAAGTLQNAGFIRYAAGKITVLDRPGLEDASCECYAVASSQFARRWRHEERDQALG